MIRPVDAIARLTAYVPPKGRETRALLLDFNENTVGPSQAAVRALRRLPPGEMARYPELEPWRARFARRLGLPPSRLFLTAGVDEALAALIQAYGRPGSEVVYPAPTFGMYRFYADRAGLKRREVGFGPNLTYPVEGLLRAIGPRTSLVLMATPNNPTGSVLPREGLVRILRKAPNALVAVDEAYIEFGGRTALPLLGRFPNLAVLRTFSKAYGLAGMRVGFVAADPRVVAVLDRAASPYRVPTASLAAAEAALADRSGVRRYADGVRREREALRRALLARGIPTPASAGNFLLMPLGTAAPRILAGLARAGIRVRDRSTDRGLGGVLRVTVGSPAQMRRFLAAFDRIRRTA